MNEFGNFLYSLRKEKGLTQVELANALKVTNKAVSKWETGEAMPETSLLLPLSKILGVTVDELLEGKKNSNKGNENNNYIYYDNNKQNKDCNSNLDNRNNKSFREDIKSHIFNEVNGNKKTLLEKISGAICVSVFLVSLTIYFFIGILINVWTPTWVIILVSALLCGIIGIIFDLFNSEKKKQKINRGENIYLGSFCGLVMLLCIISYLILGALFNLWHPYWIIIILGVVFCGIAGTIGEVFKFKNDIKDNDKNEQI